MPVSVPFPHAAREEEPREREAAPQDALPEVIEALLERRLPIAGAANQLAQLP